MASLMRFGDANIALLRSGFVKNAMFVVRLCLRMGVFAHEGKRLFWGTLFHGIRTDTRTLEAVFLSLAAWASLGPFTKGILPIIDEKIAEAERADAMRVAAE